MNLRYNTNSYQKSAIELMEKYKAKHPDIVVYDVIGILPRKTNYFAFIGPGEGNSKEPILHHLRQNNPDMILQVFKCMFLELQLSDFLQSHMIPIEDGIWTKGQKLTPFITPNSFKHSARIEGKAYWIMPPPKEKNIYTLSAPVKLINSEILYLDKTLKVTSETPHFIAVPQRYLELGLSDFEPTGILVSPNKLFRFDTGF